MAPSMASAPLLAKNDLRRRGEGMMCASFSANSPVAGEW